MTSTYAVAYAVRGTFARTQCYLFRPNDAVDTPFREAFLCFADDGVPLMVDMALRDGSSFVLEGRVVRRTASDADFRPPGGP